MELSGIKGTTLHSQFCQVAYVGMRDQIKRSSLRLLLYLLYPVETTTSDLPRSSLIYSTNLNQLGTLIIVFSSVDTALCSLFLPFEFLDEDERFSESCDLFTENLILGYLFSARKSIKPLIQTRYFNSNAPSRFLDIKTWLCLEQLALKSFQSTLKSSLNQIFYSIVLYSAFLCFISLTYLSKASKSYTFKDQTY